MVSTIAATTLPDSALRAVPTVGPSPEKRALSTRPAVVGLGFSGSPSKTPVSLRTAYGDSRLPRTHVNMRWPSAEAGVTAKPAGVCPKVLYFVTHTDPARRSKSPTRI